MSFFFQALWLQQVAQNSKSALFLSLLLETVSTFGESLVSKRYNVYRKWTVGRYYNPRNVKMYTHCYYMFMSPHARIYTFHPFNG